MGARGRAPRRVITEMGAVWGRGRRFRTSSISELPTGRPGPSQRMRARSRGTARRAGAPGGIAGQLGARL